MLGLANRLVGWVREAARDRLVRKASRTDSLNEVIERAAERNRIDREIEFMSPDERKHWLSGGWRRGDR